MARLCPLLRSLLFGLDIALCLSLCPLYALLAEDIKVQLPSVKLSEWVAETLQQINVTFVSVPPAYFLFHRYQPDTLSNKHPTQWHSSCRTFPVTTYSGTHAIQMLRIFSSSLGWVLLSSGLYQDTVTCIVVCEPFLKEFVLSFSSSCSLCFSE